MADSKITALTSIGASTDPANDPLVLVDVSDTSMAATGTTKKVTLNQLLGASGTATLASATITGDLTVDTNTLKVDSANNRVGIGTASPGCNLEVYSSSANELRVSTITAGDVRLGMSVIGTTYNWIDSLRSGGAMVFGVGNAEHYRITSGGTFTWSDGGGGTRMTLNSTGLLVGTTATSYGAAGRGLVVAGGSTSAIIGMRVGSTDTGYIFADATKVELGGNGAVPIVINNGGAAITIDTARNVGIGVTPSASDGTLRTLNVGYTGVMYGFVGTSEAAGFGSNYYYNAGWKYRQNGTATNFSTSSGKFVFSTSASGTAGNAITWTDAMTLDASGNLLVGDTTSPLASRLSLFTTFAQPDGIVIRNTGATAGLYWRFGAVNNSNTLFVMNASSVGVTMADGASAWSAVSDERLKDIIEPISNAVAKIGSLRSVIGKYKSDSEGTRRSFLIAQDVKSVLPEAVDSTDIESLGLRYTEVIPLLVAAIKELTARVQTLETR